MHDVAAWLALMIGQGLLLAVLITLLIVVHKHTGRLKELEKRQKLFQEATEKEEDNGKESIL